MTWITRAPSPHTCRRPEGEFIAGALWRCDTCGHLWRIYRSFGGGGMSWASADWWLRWLHRNAGYAKETDQP